MNRQDMIDTYHRYEREVEQAEANARRLRKRMAKIATWLVGTEGERDIFAGLEFEPVAISPEDHAALVRRIKNTRQEGYDCDAMPDYTRLA
jgi:hypothetical protein